LFVLDVTPLPSSEGELVLWRSVHRRRDFQVCLSSPCMIGVPFLTKKSFCEFVSVMFAFGVSTALWIMLGFVNFKDL
jgi:hypothetical protein